MNTPPKYSVRNILIDNNWEIYKINHPELDRYIINEVEKMLDCCNPEKGFFYGYCENCKKEIIMHIKCNGKVCSRCGKQYVDKWVEKSKNKIFNEPHKLVSLTIPADLRNIFNGRWNLMQLLQDSAYETIRITAEKTLRKKVKVGMLVGLQTYGQDMKLHPHLHCAVLEKVNYKGKLIDFKYIPSECLRRVWRNIIVKNLCKAKISYEEKELAYSMLDRYPAGFVTNVEESKNKIGTIRYLARYMRHPPISNHRIIFYGRGKVIIRMKDKQRRSYSTWFTIEEFINRLILHIPPKNFKVVRWYGLYSRREVRISRIKEVQETIIPVFETKKKIIRCPKCKSPLKNVICIINKPPDKRKLMNELNYWIEELVSMPKALS